MHRGQLTRAERKGAKLRMNKKYRGFRQLTVQRSAPTISLQQQSYSWLQERSSTVGDAYYLVDVLNYRVVEANRLFLTLMGYDVAELRRLPLQAFIMAPEEEIKARITEALRNGRSLLSLRQYRRKDGSMLFVEVQTEILLSHKRKYLFIRVKDITAAEHLKNRLQLSAQVFDCASDAILVTDAEGVIQFVNPAFMKTTGYDLEDVLGMTPRILKSGRHTELFYQELWRALNEEGQWKGEIWNRKKNGDVYPIWNVINAIKNEAGRVVLYAAVGRDLTERLEYEEKIRHQAYHDGLTGLPNRIFFYENVRQVIEEAARYERMAAVIFLDLDGFKRINDEMGHDAGDQVLKEVARRMRSAVRASDVVARMGGDEFTVVLTEISGWRDAQKVAEKIREQIHLPLLLPGGEVRVSSSIGISIYPEHGREAETLVKRADHAMYEAKAAGKNTYRMYQPNDGGGEL